MKTTLIVALIGVVGLVALAGTVIASGIQTQALSSQSTSGEGAMHSGMYQYMHQNQYNHSSAGCPTDHDYNYDRNYSWDYDNGGCGGACQNR